MTTYNISKVIREVRKSRNMSVAELADLTDSAVSYIYHLEAGTKNPSFDTIKALCNALEFPIPLMIMKSLEGDKTATEITQALEKQYTVTD